jgi:hypothetical protein
VRSIAIASSYEGVANFLLLDSYRSAAKQIGALGVTHDWNISRRIVHVTCVPIVLASGLGPDNVAEAIRRLRVPPSPLHDPSVHELHDEFSWGRETVRCVLDWGHQSG